MKGLSVRLCIWSSTITPATSSTLCVALAYGYAYGVVRSCMPLAKLFRAVALVPLLLFTRDSKLMGELVNTRWVKRIGWAIVAIVVTLNGWLLIGTLFN